MATGFLAFATSDFLVVCSTCAGSEFIWIKIVHKFDSRQKNFWQTKSLTNALCDVRYILSDLHLIPHSYPLPAIFAY